ELLAFDINLPESSKSPQAATSSPRRNALTPEQVQKSVKSAQKVNIAGAEDRMSHETDHGHRDDPSDRHQSRNDQPRARDDREAIKPKPWAPPRPPRPDEGSNALENTSDAVYIFQNWIRARHKMAKGDASPTLQQQLENLKTKFGDALKEADTATLSAVLETYCRSKNAPKEAGLTRMILEKVKGEGVMRGLWQDRAFLRIVDDEVWGPVLTRLLSYACMSGEEVEGLVGEEW
ncbi:MAG: hypothetical protein Q9181_007158, partial [Wetmoreana brouardii]